MPRESKARKELRDEVYVSMRQYLAIHPEQAYQIALDCVNLITQKTTTSGLVEWRDSLQNTLDREAKRKPVALPPLRPAAKPTKRKSKKRKVKK